jgi:cyclohexyl-isocyanide hydratase
MTTHIGLLLYPGLTQLDLTGPYEVFHGVPDATVHLVGLSLDPVTSDSGLTMMPTVALEDCPPLDVICVPGGFGQTALMDDQRVLSFLRQQAETAKWVTAVCTGSLLLGAAGLLNGYAATTHWVFTDLLPMFGAKPTPGRVVVDRNRITAGGVTAGIDFGLHLVAELAGETTAKTIQLALEYDPAPPFRSGHPSVAEASVVASLRERFAERVAARRAKLAT